MKKNVAKMLLCLILCCCMVPLYGFAEEADMIDGNTYASGLPIVKEPITLKVAMVAQPAHGDIPSMKFFTTLTEQSNIQIEWTIIPSASASDQVSLIINTGDLPDIFLGTSILNETSVLKYANDGLFIALDDLIYQYAPNIVAAFERSPGFKAACTNVEDGKIYSVGRAAERVPKMNSDVLFIYKPWLDSLNLDVPQTIEEFENALRAFKTQDPNGNGRADEVPFSFTMGNNQNDLHSLFGAFGRCDYSSSTTSGHFVAEEDGTLVFTANKEEYKNAVIWMHKMFQEGLFDQEGLISKDTKSLIALGNSEDVILGSFIGYDVANYVPADRIDDYIALAPLEGPNGDRIWSISGWTNGNISGNGFVITYTNPYPEASIRWLNEFFKQDNSVQIFLGPEGVCLEKNADGMYTYIPTPEGKSYNEFRFGNAPVHVPCIILSEDWNTVVEVMDEDVVKTKIMEIYKPYMTNTVPYFKFSSSEAEYLNSYGTEILEYVNSQLFTWLLNGGIESEWDSYCKKLEDMGVDELYDVVNTAYLRLQ